MTMRPFVIVIAPALWLGTPGAAAAQAPTAHDVPVKVADSSVVVRTPTHTQKEIAAFWTPERRRAAITVTLPVTAPAPARWPRERTIESAAAHRASAPGTAPRAAAHGWRVTVGPVAEVWQTHGVRPATTIGKLYAAAHDGREIVCSASVIEANNRSTVWTAGHCVHGGPDAGWFSMFAFEPDYHDSQAPLGTWFSDLGVTLTSWAEDGDRTFDIGAVVMDTRDGTRIADVTGTQGYIFGDTYEHAAHIFGYPRGGRPIFNGERLTYCTGTTGPLLDDPDTYLTSLDCDMGGGASGGPWIKDLQPARGWGYIVGATSGRPQIPDPTMIVTAKHDEAAISLHDTAGNLPACFPDPQCEDAPAL
jgi:hypothetical protein